MKIYFAGSIRGGRDDVKIYYEIIDYLKTKGTVLTEHVGNSELSSYGEETSSDEYIHNRDLKWISESDIIVAEVTTPSLGVGYEIGRALENDKKILCLHQKQEGKRLSAMIAGCTGIEVGEYENIEEAKKIVDSFMNK